MDLVEEMRLVGQGKYGPTTVRIKKPKVGGNENQLIASQSLPPPADCKLSNTLLKSRREIAASCHPGGASTRGRDVSYPLNHSVKSEPDKSWNPGTLERARAQVLPLGKELAGIFGSIMLLNQELKTCSSPGTAVIPVLVVSPWMLLLLDGAQQLFHDQVNMVV